MTDDLAEADSREDSRALIVLPASILQFKEIAAITREKFYVLSLSLSFSRYNFISLQL